jgi:ABC-type cobalt transport system substrate-binding protein
MMIELSGNINRLCFVARAMLGEINIYYLLKRGGAKRL